MYLVHPDSLERPASRLQTTNNQHTWPRQSTAAVNTSGSRVVHRSRPFSSLGLLLSWSIASPSLGPSQSIVIRPPLHGRAAPLVLWNGMLRRRARPVPDWIVDRPSPGGCSSGPSAWDKWEMCSPEADPVSAKRGASLSLVAFVADSWAQLGHRYFVLAAHNAP